MQNPSTDILRMQHLTHWVAIQTKQPITQIQLTAISSDAGFRRYFRFNTPSRWLAVDAPPATEDTQQFVQLANFLHEQGIKTPQILAADEQQGFLLVEDFGDDLLHRQLTPTNADQLYNQCFNILLQLHQCPEQPGFIPPYDQALLHRELLLFNEWFCEKLLEHPLSEKEISLLANVFEQLETCALSQPQILVHRDFHSRNILCRTSDALGIIDFQGALWGPCAYDLASLLRDCYKRWPATQVKQWVNGYRLTAIQKGFLSEQISEDEFLMWFDWIGLQRHIKVLGIFARLHLRDGKSHYLADLPLVIRYVLEVCESYPSLVPFAHWFKVTLLPKAMVQPWYEDYQQAGEHHV